MSKEEPARRYALYIPTIGKRRPGRPRTSYLNYVQRLLGDNEGAMQEQQIAAFADDRHAWKHLVVACSAADGWWWWCTVTLNSNFAILKTWNYFQLELKNYLSLYFCGKKPTVTVHYGLWTKCTQLWPLNRLLSIFLRNRSLSNARWF